MDCAFMMFMVFLSQVWRYGLARRQPEDDVEVHSSHEQQVSEDASLMSHCYSDKVLFKVLSLNMIIRNMLAFTILAHYMLALNVLILDMHALNMPVCMPICRIVTCLHCWMPKTADWPRGES